MKSASHGAPITESEGGLASSCPGGSESCYRIYTYIMVFKLQSDSYIYSVDADEIGENKALFLFVSIFVGVLIYPCIYAHRKFQ